MPDPYPILGVTESLIANPEPMGGKEKFWYHPDGEERGWLFKYPRPGTGEHWAEKLAAEIANALDIPHALVELAQYAGVRGTVTESFIDERQSLFHGNQILTVIFANYDPEVRFRQSNHTIDNIYESLAIFADAPEEASLLFSQYVVLDALIGNTDRHHENWALIQGFGEPDQAGWQTFHSSLAPSFDHASSLGRELPDRRRQELMNESRVDVYAERAVGGIYWTPSERRAPSPMRLVRLSANKRPEFFSPALRNLNRLNEESLHAIVDRIPEDWMSPPAREFAFSLLCYNLAQLRELM
jgi:hypothetical protein